MYGGDVFWGMRNVEELIRRVTVALGQKKGDLEIMCLGNVSMLRLK